MTPDQWRRVGELFHEALDLPPAERTQWAQSCEADPEVHRELVSLLDNDRAIAGGFVEQKVKSAVVSFFQGEASSNADLRIGAYKLLRELGRGGMGTVYLAERDDQHYQTKVAIKLVRLGMDTEIILHRFRRERQILAQLQHPHIARLLDGGSTGDGRPYIVMEYIPGVPITEYSKSRVLGIPERLKLFLDVCSAVEYAHQHFVVHRDIKPGNILISDAGDAKLLDFGICKLLQNEALHETASGTLHMLTPEYASPEQVRGDPITIASDIYSLAAVLYELLTGFKPHRIDKFTPQAVERAICEVDIIRPSLVPDKPLARKLSGDLDNILMLALQKEPERRYASVEQFSEDIRRYLSHEPVRARPDTLGYRARKFIRRQGKLVVAAGVVIACLAAGILVSWHEANVARSNLLQARRLANVFVFDVHDAVRDLPGSTRARQLIVETGLRFLDELARNSSRDWELKAELATAYQRIGDVEGNVMGANLGNTRAALESYRKAASFLDSILSHDPSNRQAQLDRLTVQLRTGVVYGYTQDAEHALADLRAAQTMGEQLLAKYPGDESISGRLAEVHAAAGDALWIRGEYNASMQENSKAIELLQPLASAHPENRTFQQTLATAYSAIGMDQTRLGHLDEALQLYRRAIPIFEDLTHKDPANASYQRALFSVYSHLGDALGNPKWKSLGDNAGALAAYRQMLAVARHLYETDPANQQAVSDYAIGLTRVAAVLPEPHPVERIPMLEESLKLLRQIDSLDPQNTRNRWDLSHGYSLLGDAQAAAGDLAAAASSYQQCISLAESLLAVGINLPAPDLVGALSKLALLDARRADRNSALQHARRAVEISQPDGPYANGRTMTARRYLKPRGAAAMGLTYAALARSAEAVPGDRASAIEWLGKSLAAWRELQSDPAFAPPQRREMQQVEDTLKELGRR